MRVFHFPKHIFLLFFTLVFTAFFSLGIAGYIWAMKTENVYYLEDKANIGDYVISPSDIIGRNGGEPYGIVPVSTNYFIENAEEICKELNSMGGVSSLPVACVESYFTYVVKGELKTKDSWFLNKTTNNIGLRLRNDGSDYFLISSSNSSPYYNDAIYGVDSGLLLDFYKEEGFEFYGLTGEKGVYLSEAIKNSLEINETDKEVTLLVSCRGRNAFDGGVLSVPIAGFFRAPEKDYKTEIREGERIERFRSDDPVFMFLDIEYFTSIFSIYKESFPPNEEYDDLFSSIAAKKGRVKTEIVPVSYQNIWIRGGNEKALKNVIAKTGQPLSVDSTFKLFLSLDRFYSFMTTLEIVGRCLFVLLGIVILFMGWSVVKRLLDYEDKTTLLLYASGSSKKSIVLRLYLPIIIPTLLFGSLGFYAGIKEFQRFLKTEPVFFVTVDRTIRFLSVPLSVLIISFVLIVLLSVYTFVNTHTSFEGSKRRGK